MVGFTTHFPNYALAILFFCFILLVKHTISAMLQKIKKICPISTFFGRSVIDLFMYRNIIQLVLFRNPVQQDLHDSLKCELRLSVRIFHHVDNVVNRRNTLTQTHPSHIKNSSQSFSLFDYPSHNCKHVIKGIKFSLTC